jgi:hypothetical protein
MLEIQNPSNTQGIWSVNYDSLNAVALFIQVPITPTALSEDLSL